jgi:hypothetical protein
MAEDKGLVNFSRMADALSPWLGHIVVIGGWAHRLYQYHPLAQALDHPTLTTLDVDIAVPDRLPKDSAIDMRESLVKAGFEEEFLGQDSPPATHFRLGNDPSGFYAEFITPLAGGDYKRGGKRDVTMRIGGVNAQKLRYVELLLESPWSIKLESSKGFSTAKSFQVHLANPAAYIAQKILVLERRSREERGKEILYIHDTIELFARVLPQIRAEWTGKIKPRVQRKAGNS